MAKQVNLVDFFEEKNLQKIVLKCEYLLDHKKVSEMYKKHPHYYEAPPKALSETYYDRILSRHFPPLSEVLEGWSTLSSDQQSRLKLFSEYVVDVYFKVFNKKSVPFILNAFW